MGATRVCLAIEDTALRMLVVEGRRVQGWMSYPLAPGVVQEGVVTSAWSLQATLSSLLWGRAGVRGRTLVSFPGSRGLFRTIALPRLKPRLMAEAVASEAKRELPMSTALLHLFWQPFHVTRDRQELLLVAVPREPYERLHSAFRAARLRPRWWELKPLALVRAVGRPNALILDLEDSGADLVLVVQGVPRLVRSLALGPEGSDQERAHALLGEVARSIEYYQATERSGTWEPKTPLVLTGRLADGSELGRALQSLSPLPVEPFQCPLGAAKEFPAATYASAIGVALKRGRRRPDREGWRPVDFNVLPPQYQRVLLPPRALATGLGLAAGVLLLAPVTQLRAGQEAGLRQQHAELAALQYQVRLAKASLAQRTEVQKSMDEIATQIQDLEGQRESIVATGSVKADELTAVWQVLTPGIALLRVATQKDGLVVEGEAATYEAVLEYVGALEQGGHFQAVAVTRLSLTGPAGAPGRVTFGVTLSKTARQGQG
ncbi:MAG: hypothetical protein HY683_06425 [Chloroflexi bacterium]|nr:hypothetical protein [Chloroflexota bacterium]